MRSSNPAVVEVTSTGALLASRNGTARIETLHGEGSILEVEVRAADAIEIVPSRVVLRPGESSALAIIDLASGAHLSPAVAEWRSSAGGAVIVRDGVVTAGGEAGAAQVIARYGATEARAEVVVRGDGGRLSLIPAKVKLRLGEVRAFQAYSEHGAVGARWVSRDGRVIAHLGQMLFQARSVGRTKVCASAVGLEGCSDVEVTR